MRILMVEDSAIIHTSTELLAEFGHVDIADNIPYARYFIDEDPGVSRYDVIIFDLKLPPLGLTDEQKVRALKLSAGWVYLDEEFSVHHPHELDKVIIYSAYIPSLIRAVGPDAVNRYKHIDKGEADSVGALINVVRKARNIRTT